MRRHYTPHPSPPPQGGRERPLVVARCCRDDSVASSHHSTIDNRNDRKLPSLPPCGGGLGGGRIVPQSLEANPASSAAECGDTISPTPALPRKGGGSDRWL